MCLFKKGIFISGSKDVGAYKCSGIVSLEDDGVASEQLIGKSEQIPLKEVHDHLIVVASRSHCRLKRNHILQI